MLTVLLLIAKTHFKCYYNVIYLLLFDVKWKNVFIFSNLRKI